MTEQMPGNGNSITPGNGYPGPIFNGDLGRVPEETDNVPGLDMTTVKNLVWVDLWPGCQLVGMAYLQPPEGWEPNWELKQQLDNVDFQISTSPFLQNEELERNRADIIQSRKNDLRERIPLNPSPTLDQLKSELRTRGYDSDDNDALLAIQVLSEYTSNWPVKVLLENPDGSPRAIAVTRNPKTSEYYIHIIGTGYASEEAFESVKEQLHTDEGRILFSAEDFSETDRFAESGRGFIITNALTTKREIYRLPGGGAHIILTINSEELPFPV